MIVFVFSTRTPLLGGVLRIRHSAERVTVLRTKATANSLAQNCSRKDDPVLFK